MKDKIEFKNEIELKNLIQENISVLKKIIPNQNSNNIFSNKKNFFLTNKTLSSLFYSNFKDSVLKNIIKILKNACYEAEIASACGADITYLLTLFQLENSLKFGFLTDKNQLIKIISSINKIKKKFSIDNIDEIANNVFDPEDRILKSIFKEAIILSGPDGSIIVDNNSSSSTSIELVDGYTTKFDPFEIFYGTDKKWQKSFLKTFIVDGIIENIHEIDQLLIESNKTKIPLVIFARGFGEEVLNTLKLNNDLGNFDIFPIKIRQEENNLNLINDIAVVCGTDIVSTLKGDVLSLVKYDNLSLIEKIICHKNNFTIINYQTKNRVSLQIRNIIEERNQKIDSKMEDSYNFRLKFLNHRSIKINIPFISEEEKIKNNEKLDYALRIFRTCLNSGLLDLTKKDYIFKECENSPIFKDILENTFNHLNCIIPIESFIISLKKSYAITKQLSSLSGALLLKD